MTNKAMCDIGVVGLGVMGRNLLLNMADHGFSVAGYDLDANKVQQLHQEAQTPNIQGTTELKTFIDSLKLPRAILLLVPAGKAVDAIIEEFSPLLQKGDLIIDAGNSYFKDTDARCQKLLEKNLHFIGVGVSGGEEGARHGPSIMPGGDPQAYARIQPILEAITARAHGQPCVSYMGSGSAGHFVKMVHNGMEYGLMQLITESYDLMKHVGQLTDAQLQQTFHDWNESELNSYLIEITSHVLKQPDPVTGGLLINQIKAVARQKGTGMWTSQSAMDLQVPVPTIDAAVMMRDLSMQEDTLHQMKGRYARATSKGSVDVAQLKSALFAAMILTYVQGMALLGKASQQYNYGLNLSDVARIWRGGCIIRASLLDTLSAAFVSEPGLSQLLLAPEIQAVLAPHLGALRHIVCQAATSGTPTPALMASLGYFDAYSSGSSPANLIQAQRDYFGSHTYERIDASGAFHTEWSHS